VSCSWETREVGSAVSPSDFVEAKGTLEFADGTTSKKISIDIVNDGRYERDEMFQVVLTEPVGCSFTKDSDGAPELAIATVTIRSDEILKKGADRLAELLDLNVDNIKLGASSWSEQFADAFAFEGGGAVAFIMFLLSFPWKLIVACVPPTRFGGGWVCFLSCLVLIGVMTALVGDLAALVGCCLGISPAVTAITFVALGTSLPDTFASLQAALSEPYADNAIGNITGSNAVNVFLGLGLPWMVAAFYWAGASSEDEAAWRARYQNEDWYSPSLPVGFAVPSADLGFSVCVFVVTAVLCLGSLVLRRVTLGFELGGPYETKAATAIFFVFLWAVYLAASISADVGLLPKSVVQFI